MLSFLVRRLLGALGTIAVAVIVLFVLVRLLPNNAALAQLGQHAPEAQVQRLMDEQGWNRPLGEQFVEFFGRFFTTGDLGRSFRGGRPVTEELGERFAATIELTTVALLIGVPLGLIAGVAAAVWKNGWPDRLVMFISLVGVSVPVFFLGMCLLITLGGWLSDGRLDPGSGYRFQSDFVFFESLVRLDPALVANTLRHILLPALALSTIPLAYVARITRASLLEVLSADYVRTARSKGCSPARVIWRHALPTASIPIVNIAGLQLGVLLSGAVLTETVFSWPGLGRWMVEGVQRSDYPVVQGGVMLTATLFVLLNLVIDLTYAWLDPRVRLEGRTDG
jgi:peptide/nickel transport system permease protein